MKKAALFLLVAMPFANVALADDYTLKVDGLACQHCADKLEGELKALEGVQSVSFDLAAKQVEVSVAEGQSLQEDQLRKTVKDAGFTLVEMVKPASEKKS